MALIEIEHPKKYPNVASGIDHTVDDITLKIEKGHTMGIVGESGCGKSTLDRIIIHLHEATDGVIRLGGKDITHASGKELRQTREKMQIIFQDPHASLNPRTTMEAAVREPLVEAHRFSKTEITWRTGELMDRAGIEEQLRLSYPHGLDGEWRQCIDIARVVTLNPEFTICDESVSAPDVLIQAQVLNLLMDLQEEYGLTYMLVTHDLPVMRHISDDISMMYLEQPVETSSVKELFCRAPRPYIKALLPTISFMDIYHPMQRV